VWFAASRRKHRLTIFNIPQLMNKNSAQRLAVAFLRKTATKTRFLPSPAGSTETDTAWIFDFHHPKWRYLRRKNKVPYGLRIAVDKQTGKAEHSATLQNE
jgi:hypothetical protein